MPPTIASDWVEALPWAEVCLVCVAFVCGAAVGSFLNVVAHRIPRGESPVMGGSRCPACGTGILPRDNVPVLGWILLHGRCRSCCAAIPSRYILVEVACGAFLATLAGAQLACDRHGLDRLLIRGDLQPVLSFAGQAAVLMTLMAWSLLAERGHRATMATRWLAMAAALGWFVFVSTVKARSAETIPMSSWPTLGSVWTSLAGGGLGWLAGFSIGYLSRRLNSDGGAFMQTRDMLALVGLAFGWQTVLPVVAAATTFRVAARGSPVECHAVPPATLLVLSACGRWLHSIAQFFGQFP